MTPQCASDPLCMGRAVWTNRHREKVCNKHLKAAANGTKRQQANEAREVLERIRRIG